MCRVSGKWEILWACTQPACEFCRVSWGLRWGLAPSSPGCPERVAQAALKHCGSSPLQVVLGGGQEAMDVTTTSTRIGKFEARLVLFPLAELSPLLEED